MITPLPYLLRNLSLQLTFQGFYFGPTLGNSCHLLQPSRIFSLDGVSFLAVVLVINGENTSLKIFFIKIKKKIIFFRD
jgi:hypothetical protein